MKFFIFIFVLLVFLIFINKPIDGQIMLIFANIRTGKTTLLSKLAQRELKLMKKGKSKYQFIISNTPISGCQYVSDIRMLFKKNSAPEHTLILVDEGYLVFPNRKMAMSDSEIEYIKLIGHYQSKLIIVSQSYEDIDIVIRRIYTSMYLLNKVGSFTFITPIKKSIGIDQDSKQIIEQYKFRWFFSWRLFFRPLYYRFFDTYWRPDGRVHPCFDNFQIVPYPDRSNFFIKIKQKLKNSLHV